MFFTDQVGIPLRKYLLWRRLFDAVALLIQGENITGAAYNSGFSDSAHLSRTFKDNFGINLSKVIKNRISFNRLIRKIKSIPIRTTIKNGIEN